MSCWCPAYVPGIVTFSSHCRYRRLQFLPKEDTINQLETTHLLCDNNPKKQFSFNSAWLPTIMPLPPGK